MHQIYMYILCWQMPSHCTLSTECDSLQRAILQNNKVFLWHFFTFFFNDNNDVGSDCSLDNIDTTYDIIDASLEIIDKIISLDNIGISLDKIDISFDNWTVISERHIGIVKLIFSRIKLVCGTIIDLDYEVPLFS